MQNDAGMNYQELNALLNWAPEVEMSTMGEVRAFLKEARNLLRLMDEKHEQALEACQSLGMLVAMEHGPQSPAAMNAVSLFTLMAHMGEAMAHCLSRDIVLMETFIDAFAGDDNHAVDLPF